VVDLRDGLLKDELLIAYSFSPYNVAQEPFIIALRISAKKAVVERTHVCVRDTGISRMNGS